MSGKHCNPTGKRFKATGTIRVQIGRSDGGPARMAKIFLTPNREYCASHAGKHYAIFFPVKGGGHEAKSTPYESGEGVPICVQGDFGDLLAAAVQQTTVEIEVVKKRKKLAWKLRTITVPAPGKKK